MNPPRWSLLVSVLLVSSAAAKEAPSWSRHVKPFLAKYCVESHPGQDPDGGLSLDSYKGLLAGGNAGVALVHGKPDASRLLGVMEGRTRPAMPPRRSPQPKKDEIALVRAWVAAGAKEDVVTGVTL